jgi:hypothetical protein
MSSGGAPEDPSVAAERWSKLVNRLVEQRDEISSLQAECAAHPCVAQLPEDAVRVSDDRAHTATAETDTIVRECDASDMARGVRQTWDNEVVLTDLRARRSQLQRLRQQQEGSNSNTETDEAVAARLFSTNSSNGANSSDANKETPDNDETS